jgi:hypothetical protein
LGQVALLQECILEQNRDTSASNFSLNDFSATVVDGKAANQAEDITAASEAGCWESVASSVSFVAALALAKHYRAPAHVDQDFLMRIHQLNVDTSKGLEVNGPSLLKEHRIFLLGALVHLHRRLVFISHLRFILC